MMRSATNNSSSGSGSSANTTTTTIIPSNRHYTMFVMPLMALIVYVVYELYALQQEQTQVLSNHSSISKLQCPQQQQQAKDDDDHLLYLFTTPNATLINTTTTTTTTSKNDDEQPPQPQIIHTTPTSVSFDSYKCDLTTAPYHSWAKMRLIVFQRNGAKQLVSFMTHHLHLLPPDAIVIIDHESEPNGMTKTTLLPQYQQMGVHIWSCNGDYVWGRVHMWSMVINVYKHDSQFVFPLDADELLAVFGDDNSSSINSNGTTTTTDNDDMHITWDRRNLYRALTTDLIGKSSGKPFKMETVEAIPGDCVTTAASSSLSMSSTTTTTTNNNNTRRSSKAQQLHFPSPICEMTHVRRLGVGCMQKNFCYGTDFVQTDLGNHFLVTNWTTHAAPENTNNEYNVIGRCNADGVDVWYERSRFMIIHVQRLEFADWILHYLRGASVHGYSGRDYNCANAGLASYYCDQFKEFEQVNFAIDTLRTTYQEKTCGDIDLNDPTIRSISNVFAHSCPTYSSST